MRPSCDQCQFFAAHPPTHDRSSIVVSGSGIRGGGECRRQPPVWSQHETLGCFPIVASDWWCGCFKSLSTE